MKKFLHVGCGPKKKDQTVSALNTEEWHEIRLDIDSNVSPDVLGTMTDMSQVDSKSVQAIFSSHNIEHLYPHEVPLALSEFIRVLSDDGIVIITCPDLQSVCQLVADDKLTEPAYVSPAGPIAPIDILYGYRASMMRGNLFMAHRCGFTKKVLMATLQEAGFQSVAALARVTHFDLWAIASKNKLDESALLELAKKYLPVN